MTFRLGRLLGTGTLPVVLATKAAAVGTGSVPALNRSFMEPLSARATMQLPDSPARGAPRTPSLSPSHYPMRSRYSLNEAFQLPAICLGDEWL